MSNNTKMTELVEWLKGERYIIDTKSDTMTEEFENAHKWELSRNRMIEKTINKITELFGNEYSENINKKEQK